MRVACYADPKNRRSAHIATAMREGFMRSGIESGIYTELKGIQGDIAVGYGWNQRAVFDAYKDAGKHFIYIDLGYWLRKTPELRLEGYHKLSVDHWCPGVKMRRGCPPDRFNALYVPVRPWRSKGDHIVVAGMSAKSALDHGLAPEQWEQAMIARLSGPRPIIYRPKPSWTDATQLSGAELSQNQPIEQILINAHALITHHSNAAIDSLTAGIPFYCEKGVGSPLSTVDLEDIENPKFPDDKDRLQLLHDIAYTQFNVAEMRNGECWAQIKDLI